MEWNLKSVSFSVAVVVVVCINVSTAWPQATGLYKNDIYTSLYFDTCRTCFLLADDDACYTCNLGIQESGWGGDEDGGVEKRSQIFHPLLRGGYPKKSTYFPYYNPLNRGAYLKKSYTPPVYHPFLRGGYKPPTVQRNYWNNQAEDELP